MLLLLSIDLICLSKISLLKCRCLTKFGPEILPKCFKYIWWFVANIKVDFKMCLCKHSWSTHFCSPNTNQDGSPQVSYFSYRSLWTLTKTWILSRLHLHILWWMCWQCIKHFNTIYLLLCNDDALFVVCTQFDMFKKKWSGIH